jgi:hypothetical protein
MTPKGRGYWIHSYQLPSGPEWGFFFHCTRCRDEKAEKEIKKKGKRRGISLNSLRTLTEKHAQEKVIIQNHDMLGSVFTYSRPITTMHSEMKRRIQMSMIEKITSEDTRTVLLSYQSFWVASQHEEKTFSQSRTSQTA